MARTQSLVSNAVLTIASSATPQQLSVTQIFVKSFLIQALPTNTDFVYWGDLTRQNMPLSPGKGIEVNGDAMDQGTTGKIDLSTIYVKSNVNGEGVSFTYLLGL